MTHVRAINVQLMQMLSALLSTTESDTAALLMVTFAILKPTQQKFVQLLSQRPSL